MLLEHKPRPKTWQLTKVLHRDVRLGHKNTTNPGLFQNTLVLVFQYILAEIFPVLSHFGPNLTHLVLQHMLVRLGTNGPDSHRMGQIWEFLRLVLVSRTF